MQSPTVESGSRGHCYQFDRANARKTHHRENLRTSVHVLGSWCPSHHPKGEFFRRVIGAGSIQNYSTTTPSKKQTRLRTPRSGITPLKFGQLVSPVAALFHGV